MKRTVIFSTMLILALAMFSGCATRQPAEPEVEIVYRDRVVERIVYVEVAPPPEPERELHLHRVTPALLERLDDIEWIGCTINRLQFVISNAVTMDRGMDFQHRLELSGQRARIRNENVRHVILLDETTWGEGLDIQLVGHNDVMITVGFDEDRTHYLNFVNTGMEPDGLFYLSYISPEGFQAAGSGFVMYGGELFALNYAAAEGTPYLYVILSEYFEELLFARTLPGRVVPY